jgi:hypothetical protein
VGHIERKIVRASLIWPLLGALISLVVVALLSSLVFGTNYFSRDRKSVTLEMSWHRGDYHYGPNFIHLESPCISNSTLGCFCSNDFKVTTTKEFADYIETFGNNTVPTKYEVDYVNRNVTGASLLSVGDWPKSRFNDGEISLATGYRMTAANQTKAGGHIYNPGDCFPNP